MSNPKLSSLARRGLWPAVTGITAIVAIVSAALGFHSLNAEANSPTASAPQAVPVSVALVAATDVNTWDEFSGRLEAVERVDVRSRVAGAVQAVHFREGALVKQGDLLSRSIRRPTRPRSSARRRRSLAAQARVARQRQERARRAPAPAGPSSAIAQRELDERVNARREADANLRAAQAALQTAHLNLELHAGARAGRRAASASSR